jgi:hypothetical protein
MAEHVCPWWIGYFLVSPMRRWLQNPEELIKPYITPGMIVLEPGPGMGSLLCLPGGSDRVASWPSISSPNADASPRRAEKAGLLQRTSAPGCPTLGTTTPKRITASSRRCGRTMPSPEAFFNQAAALQAGRQNVVGRACATSPHFFARNWTLSACRPVEKFGCVKRFRSAVGKTVWLRRFVRRWQRKLALYNALMRLNAVSCALRAVSVALFLCLTMLPASIVHAGVAGHSAARDSASGAAIVPASKSDRAEARDIFKQLIEIDTTDSPQGSVTAGTEAMEKRFLDAGFPREDVALLGPDPRKQNLVVRFRAPAGQPAEKPILFLCHMDVVQALRSDWHTDPFQFVEKGGYFYGRGTQDMKDSDAALVATFLRLHREGYKPRRDLILALTADEEGGRFNGAAWLVQHHRELVDAAYVVNPDAGGVELDHGRPVVADVEATEKIYADFEVTATNPGGHSSRPRQDNAIYELTTALNKLAAYSFPRHASRPLGGSPPSRGAHFQFQFPHHLLGHPTLRRARQQCAATDRAGQRQLPHLSRPLP